MTRSGEGFPRYVYDASGEYSVRVGASYVVDDARLCELAEIGYARRDVAKAHDFLAAYLNVHGDDNLGECEEALWTAAVVFYAKPFGRNDARSVFDPSGFIGERLSDEGRRLHEYLRRLRHRWAAHDDGVGEDKTVAVYLPPSPPRSAYDLGLHYPGRRVISLGADIARQLEPHVAWVRDVFAAHENERRNQVARELIATNFAGLQLTGIATLEPLAVDIESVMALPSRGRT